ncbi:EP300-interacting inhibitor of differentiation 3 [Trichoplusia ni]|uniref:Non-structural maintenance of chromosomes element 4 n=1 Tax=Trichoplusia ni TaxID=7111 RepID=A0A7E5VBH0_TRINI|nr:EP300-interacting inhibitor of differentiation 3 [Trichoplusia ni]
MSSINNTQLSRSSLGSHDRKLRYRALLEDLSVLEDDTANNMELIDKTAIAVKEAKSLLAEGGVEERVRHPGEGYLDSRVLRAASDLAVRYSEAVSGNVHTYDKQMLAQHIRENPQFWEFPFPQEVPPIAFLFGTFAPTPAERRPRPARVHVERQQAAEQRAPENVERLEKVEEGSAMVSRVLKFISRWYKQHQKPLSYFHTVLDPSSFGRTVENIYHVSFLVRDGSIAVELDHVHGLPFITPVSKSQQEARDIADEKQFIVSIDMKRWQDLITAFSIDKPMMVLRR